MLLGVATGEGVGVGVTEGDGDGVGVVVGSGVGELVLFGVGVGVSTATEEESSELGDGSTFISSKLPKSPMKIKLKQTTNTATPASAICLLF